MRTISSLMDYSTQQFTLCHLLPVGFLILSQRTAFLPSFWLLHLLLLAAAVFALFFNFVYLFGTRNDLYIFNSTKESIKGVSNDVHNFGEHKAAF